MIYTARNDFDLSGDKIVADYVVDNIADDEDDASLASKKRIDREDSLIPTLKPTTMRGIPLDDLLQSQSPRGFYVTRDETKHRATEKAADVTLNVETTNSPSESDTLADKTVQPDTNGETAIDLLLDDARGNRKYSTELITTFNSDSVAHNSSYMSDGNTTPEVPLITSSARTSNANRNVIETIASSSEELTANDYTTPFNRDTDSTLGFATETELNGTLTATEANVLESSTEAGPYTRNETSNINLEETTSLPSTTARRSSTFTEPTRTDEIENKVYRRRQRVNLERGNQFGHKSRKRERGPHARSSNENQKESTKEVESAQYPRRLVTNYRGRHRFRERPNTLKQSVKEESKRMETTTATPVNETEINKSVENANHQGGSIEGETSERKKLVPKANQTRSNADSLEEQLRIEENINGFKAEVNTSTNTETTRTSGNLSSTRLKKPTTLALTALRSKTSNTIASHRKPRPTDGNSTLFDEKLDKADEIKEPAKLEKDIDQSSKAQEIAVTLADPPSSQSTPTGRSPLRNALRRKVSSTIAPRTDATTIRTTLRFASTLKDRQRPKAKDKSLRNVTTRTRRPPVLDYDYYEDEDVPVIGKTSLNEKLFLTSKGSIRCLDQGNFPHPYSCKKFITCARMVNGLVIGAEYTCPDKLSFDPVGGICNWSAGIGCKE